MEFALDQIRWYLAGCGRDCLIGIKKPAPQGAHSTSAGTDNRCVKPDGEMAMVISGVIATVTLVATLVLLFVGGLALAAVDKHFDADRQH